MPHVVEERLYAYLLDQAELSAAEETHLAECAHCQAQLAAVAQLQRELAVASRSQVVEATLQRYEALFSEVKKPPSERSLLQRLVARLVWDGRLQPAQGVRTPVQRAYRLFYATDEVEIDLLVTPQADLLDLDGEVIPSDTGLVALPVQIVFEHSVDPHAVYRTQSSTTGRFQIDGLRPGHYTLWFTPPAGKLLALEGLLIS
jgi:hypothetical protein